jgi:inorganic pyrophosphatase/exopolyphosphatase
MIIFKLIDKKTCALVTTLIFLWTSWLMPQYPAFGQTSFELPQTVQRITRTQSFDLPLIKGIAISPDRPLQFDFLVDTGDLSPGEAQIRKESSKLVKYFLAALTVPDDEQWVNLSPYEQDRIVPEGLGVTLMGRDLLKQDYILKQLTSSLMDPQNGPGKEFWKKVYAKLLDRYGTTQLSIDAVNKVWIVPDKAVLYEHDNHVFIMENHLKVMLEEDYLALQNDQTADKVALNGTGDGNENVVRKISADVIREVILPEIENEVNKGKTFSNLRQIFNSMLLATWYKRNIKGSLIGQVYVDLNKTKGVDLKDRKIKDKIFDQYVDAFKKGAYSYIREDYDPVEQTNVPRKYFSGGMNGYTRIPVEVNNNLMDSAQKASLLPKGQYFRIKVENFEIGGKERLGDALYSDDVSFDQAEAKGVVASTPDLRRKDYFYSSSLDMHVALKPLSVDAFVIKAADKLGIKLSWDDEGRVVNISRDDGLLLLRELGAQALTPKEYWQVFSEAVKAGDQEVVRSLTGKEFTEWLDVHFFENDGKYFMIEHPEIIKARDGRVTYEGKRVQIDIPRGRPGWFDPKDNIDNIGMPRHVEKIFIEGQTTWKYWDLYTEFIKDGLGSIRGYVTSSGTPSFDLGIPPGSRQPVLMLRPVYKELPGPALDGSVVREMGAFVTAYDDLVNGKINYDGFYGHLDGFLDFLNGTLRDKVGDSWTRSQDRELSRIRENVSNILGLLRFVAKSKDSWNDIVRIDAAARKLFGIKQQVLTRDDFNSFIRGSRQRLREALKNRQSIVFVMGHENPDTDTVISSLAESYRNHLVSGDNVVYIPVVQGKSIPDEIKQLLDNLEVAGSIILFNEEDYIRAFESGQARWILVDQNKAPAVQKFVSVILDHHRVSSIAERSDVPKTIEMIGSTTALIAQRMYGLGVDISGDLAKVLYGATLMDTEDRLASKMTDKDRLIMNILKKAADIEGDERFYQSLMDPLLGSHDVEELFGRDYKEDWGFGYAVAKMKGVFGAQGEDLQPDLLHGLVLLARANNQRKNFPLTIVKVVDYENNNETVNRERMYLIFNDNASPLFKDKMFELISRLLDFSFRKSPGSRHAVSRKDDFIEYWGTGTQVSRKKTAPFLEPLVAAFNRSFYSRSTGLHIQREFMKVDATVKAAAAALDIKLSWDEQDRINRINYYDAMRLLRYLGKEAMGLNEFWSVRKDAYDAHDVQMQEHLQHPGFVEFLDTIIENSRAVIDHPEITKSAAGYSYRGDRKDAAVLEGLPGLIHPDEIVAETGLPAVVHSPSQYGDPALWRYWSPDASLVVPTRGHIFLLGQPALDMKIHPDDAFPNLGMRVITKEEVVPLVSINQTDDDLEIVIDYGGSQEIIRASDFFGSISDDVTKDAAALSYGGINLHPDDFDLQIKRDADGVPLPVLQSSVSGVRIDGLFPIIADISPVGAEVFLGLAD